MSLEAIVPTPIATPEVAAEAPVVTPPPAVDKNEMRWAQMAKREKAFRAQQASFKAEREAFAKEQEEMKGIRGWKDRLVQSPLEVLQEAGVSYDQITSSILNAPSPQDQTIAELKREIAALKGGQEEIKNASKEQQTKAYQQALTQLNNDVKLLVSSDPSTYELIKANSAEEAVVTLIEEVFNKDGEIMSVEAAAKEVEEYLVEQAWQIAQTNKIKSKFAPQPVAAEPNKVTTSPAAKTLTHQGASAVSKGTTAKERRERAILAMQGKLNA